MPEPWEEWWMTERTTEDVYVRHADGMRSTIFVSEGDCTREAKLQAEARAKLAAMAPRMARLLLKLEWVDTSDGEYRERCPSCQCCTTLPPVPGQAGIPFRPHPGEHAADCELVAVLRAAGVRP